MDYILALIVFLGVTGSFLFYRKRILLPKMRRRQILDALPQPPSKSLADFKGDSDQYLNYLMEHGLSPSEITTKASLSHKQVYETFRELIEEERIEILFLKEARRMNYFDVGQAKVAMAPLVFRKGLPHTLTPDKQEMLALLDLEFKNA